MKKQQSGFTLIELVVVIVILGILAATALPKFVDFSKDAEEAAIKGVAGGLASAATINYAGCASVANDAAGKPEKCTKVTKCSEVGALLVPPMTLGEDASDTDYYLKVDTAVTKNGEAGKCELQKGDPAAYTAIYNVVGAGF